MNRGTFITVALAAVLSLPMLAPAQNKSEIALRTAIETEMVKGDLKAAVEQYKKLAEDKDRTIAAQALMRLAAVYQKQGDAQARQVYERVVRDFSDQKQTVASARTQLGLPQTGGPQRTRLVSGEVDAVSPDGRLIAYEDRGSETSSGDLTIRDVESSRTWKVTANTNSDHEAGYASVFSPDSKQIAYVWADWSKDYGELRISSVNDTSAKTWRTLAKNSTSGHIAPVAWSPDGKWIAAEADGRDTCQLLLVNAADGSSRILEESEDCFPSKGFFSPDSKYLAVDLPSGTNTLRDVYLFPIAGGAKFPVVQRSTDNRVMGWAADGRLLYTQGGIANTLWAVHISDGKVQGAAVTLYDGVGTTPLGLTSQGDLYYQIKTGGPEIFTAAIDFATEKILTPRRFSIASGGSPQWSPDGKSILYTYDNQTFLHSLETGRMVSYRGAGIPRWTADGQGYYRARGAINASDIQRIDAKTGKATDVARVSKGQAGMVLPSPDGKKIYYWQTVTGDQRYSAYVERDLFTGNEKELVRRNALGRAAISPDGKFLLVNADNNIILLVPLDGSPVRELMRSTSPRLNVTMWAPDSRSVYVWSGTEQTRDTLWNVSISGGTPRKVDLGMPLDFAGGVMMVSPDGKQVVYSAGRGTETTEVRVLENFLPPLK